MKKKAAVGVLMISTAAMLLTGCGKTYVCSSCQEKVKTAYYDAVYPNDPEQYMCEECAREYYSPLLNYKDYKVD